MFVCAECGQRHDQPGFCPADGRPLVATDDPLLGTEVGRYRLASLLGEGGMGRVYLGVQPAIGSRVAVKILSDQCARDPALLERFFAEAKAVNLIRHESIVSVLDLARLDDGRPYIVMEYVEGHVLGALIHGAPAPLGGLVQIFIEVLSALDAAHAIGIVHRDLKPDNILVTGEGHAKVLDFGIAKLAPGLSHLSPRTATGALLGTPAYMAPEQISGGAIDPRTDIYAAGIVFYEAVTGRVPFAGETLFDLMKQHLEVPPVPPSRLRPDLPIALEQVILHALEKQPGHRFPSAVAMAEATSAAANHLPPEQWKALVRGGQITGGPRSLTKASGKQRSKPPPDVPSLAHDRTAWSQPPVDATSAQSPRGRASQPPPLGTVADSPRGRASQPPPLGLAHEPTRPSLDPAAWMANAQQLPARGSPSPWPQATQASPAPIRRDAASASQTRLSPENRKKRWPIVVAVLGSAVVATVITLIAMRGGSASAEGSPEPLAGGSPDAADPSRGEPPIVLGGGSAIDHGVHIGSNVTTGPGVIIGGGAAPKTPPASLLDYDPTHFDPIKYIPKARALARKIYSDAELTEFEFYEVVTPDGNVDLTLKSSSTSYYEFRSQARSVFPPTRNAVPDDIPCYVRIDVTATGASAHIREDDECNHPLRAAPRCTFAEVWKLSRTKDTIPATIGFLNDGKWFFDHDHAGRHPGESTVSSFEDCR